MSHNNSQTQSNQSSNPAMEADRMIPKKQVLIYMFIRPIDDKGQFGAGNTGIARGSVGAAYALQQQERQRNQALQASLHTEKALPLKVQIIMKNQPTLEELLHIRCNNKP